MRFVSPVRYWYAVKVNFHQIYQFIVQMFSSWNEFDTWESTKDGLVVFDVLCSCRCWICLILVAIAVKSRCFCQPDGRSITLFEEDVYRTDNFICSSLLATKVQQKYVYQRKRSFLSLLLLMCGDVEKCTGPTESNIQDLFNQKGFKVFHQNLRGVFHNIAKLSIFLHTYKNIFSLSETHIDNSTPTQLFEIPGYIFISKNRDVGTHVGVAVYIKDGIPLFRRTDLEVNELECIWLEVNFPNTKSFPISVWYRPPSAWKFLPTNFNELLRNSLIKVSLENKKTILTGYFNINYQKVDDNGELKSIFALFQLKQIIKTATSATDKLNL